MPPACHACGDPVPEERRASITDRADGLQIDLWLCEPCTEDRPTFDRAVQEVAALGRRELDQDD